MVTRSLLWHLQRDSGEPFAEAAGVLAGGGGDASKGLRTERAVAAIKDAANDGEAHGEEGGDDIEPRQVRAEIGRAACRERV